MNTLAIDTSQTVGSVALAVKDRIESVTFGEERSHLVELDQAVRELLARQHIDIDQVERLGLVLGPGSFTGLRVGLAFAKGLVAARPLDVVTVTSLETLALQHGQAGECVAAMVDARKNEVYAGVYELAGESLAPRVIQPPTAASPVAFLTALATKPVSFVGSGAERYASCIRDVFGDDVRVTTKEATRISTKLLCHSVRQLKPVDPGKFASLEPFYIRPSDAKLRPLRRIRTRD